MVSDQKQHVGSYRLRNQQGAESGWPYWMPKWLAPLARRLVNLGHGRYLIVVTISEGEADWSIQPLGKVEKPAP